MELEEATDMTTGLPGLRKTGGPGKINL